MRNILILRKYRDYELKVEIQIRSTARHTSLILERTSSRSLPIPGESSARQRVLITMHNMMPFSNQKLKMKLWMWDLNQVHTSMNLSQQVSLRAAGLIVIIVPFSGSNTIVPFSGIGSTQQQQQQARSAPQKPRFSASSPAPW